METFKELVNVLTNPKILLIFSVVLFAAGLIFIRFFTKPWVAMAIAALSVVFFAVSTTDDNFMEIISKADNVPIVMMVVLVGFFTWLGMRRAVKNDQLMEAGEETLERRETKQKVFVWPDLVYTEFLCLILCTVALIVWSVLLDAPLEEPANPTRTPNPSKAPWYFLGLQEMLVYYDPWIAGVLLPGLIIVGLMALPYIDINPKGNGYYTWNERKFAITIFLFGFLILWVVLIFIGTFLRGPNWNFFGLFETWDVAKLEALVNVNLSEYIYVIIGGGGLPTNPLIRELPGLLLTAGYLFLLPPILAKTVFRKFYAEMGPVRFNVMIFLFLMMASLPIKMALRWAFNLKYIVAFPEYFFNI
ncbi:MAG: hypothetical protein RL885_04430 [Planctomycetota bacterium]